MSFFIFFTLFLLLCAPLYHLQQWLAEQKAIKEYDVQHGQWEIIPAPKATINLKRTRPRKATRKGLIESGVSPRVIDSARRQLRSSSYFAKKDFMTERLIGLALKDVQRKMKAAQRKAKRQIRSVNTLTDNIFQNQSQVA